MKDRKTDRNAVGKVTRKNIILENKVFICLRTVLSAPWRFRRAVSEWKREELRKHATKMHKILYKCPCCHTEMHMLSWREWIWCESCGGRWMFWKNRRVLPLSTKIAFRTRDEWKNWERECVREEVKEGTYYFTDTVRVKIQTAAGEHLDWGYGTLTQTPEYIMLECRYGNEDYTLIRTARTLENLPFELGKEGKADYIELGSASETFICYLSKKDAAVKLALAAEESHKLLQQDSRYMQKKILK